MQPQGLLGENWNGESRAQCAGRASQGGQSTMHVASVQDCLQRIGNFLWTHSSIASTLTCTSLALTVANSSFLGLLLSRPALLLPRQKQSWVTASDQHSNHGTARIFQAQSAGRSQPLTQGGGLVSVSCSSFLNPANFPGSGKALPSGLLVAADAWASLLIVPGIRYDALRLPVVCHLLLLWLGSQRQIYPDPTVGPSLSRRILQHHRVPVYLCLPWQICCYPCPVRQVWPP